MEKQGEWYKVTFEKEGLRITGFVHEMLVREMTEDEVAKAEASKRVEAFETQTEIIQEIEIRMEQGRQLIRQQSDYEKAIESLDPLIAQAFSVGLTPLLYNSKSPRVSLELEKDGYKAVADEIFLSQVNTDKHYVLDRMGRNLEVKSIPQGAKVLLDERDTGKRTDCVLSYVPFGVHKMKLAKENYAEWEDTIEIPEGLDPLSVSVLLTGKNYMSYAVWGAPDSQLFQKPSGIAIDGDGYIYVADSGNNRIKKFSEKGQLITEWGDTGTSEEKLNYPMGIAVDSRGNVLIVERENNRIQAFRVMSDSETE